MRWSASPLTIHLHVPSHNDVHQGRHHSPLHYHPQRQRSHQAQPSPPTHFRRRPLWYLLLSQPLSLRQCGRGGRIQWHLWHCIYSHTPRPHTTLPRTLPHDLPPRPPYLPRPFPTFPPPPPPVKSPSPPPTASPTTRTAAAR